MINISGFYAYAGYADNDPKKTAKFGELSQYSATFTRELGIYTDTASPKTVLMVFSAKDEKEAQQQLDDSTANRILQVGQWLLEKASKGDIQEDRTQLLTYLKEDFGSFLTGIDVPVPTTNSNVYLPAWISFTISATGDKVKVWLSDSVFQAQYPLYEYEMIPPVPADNIDIFFEDIEVLKSAVLKRSAEALAEEINEVRNKYPDTLLWTKTYPAYQFTDKTKTFDVDWTLAIYGRAGDNIDNIRDFVQTWILEHSTHSREDWEVVQPDWFIPTEHIFIPVWNRHSAPDLTNQARIYSPIVDDELVTKYLNTFTTGYGTVTQTRKSLQTVPTQWRSLPFLSVGNPRNRDGFVKLYDRWPEYALISSTSLDIDRISDDTRDFITFTYDMLRIAEIITDDDPVPLGYNRVVRGAGTYLARSHKGVQYLFLTKVSFLVKFPDEPDTRVGG